MTKKVIVIIPVHNAASTIKNIISNLKLALPSLHYVVIDDGSTDNTSLVCQQNYYNLITLKNQQGLDFALQTGYKFALMHNYEYVICFEGSSSYNPHDLVLFKDKITSQHYDIILGNRFKAKQKKSFFSTYLSWRIAFSKLKKINDPTTGFFLLSRRIINRLFQVNGVNLSPAFLIEQIARKALISEISVNYSLVKDKYFNNYNFYKAFCEIMVHNLFHPYAKIKSKRSKN